MNGSPLYQLAAEHAVGVLALIAVPIVLGLLRRKGTYRLTPIEWLLVGLLLGSAAVHAGLLIGNDHGPAVGLLFIADAAFLVLVARRVLRGSPAGRLGVAVLVGSVLAYWGAMINEPPDQLGLATKLGEILALVIIVRPAPIGRPRRLSAFARGLAICVLVAGTAATSWVGAFHASAGGPGAVAGHHVHSGGVSPPGVIMPAVPAREATPAERAAATELVMTARRELARYTDPAVAAAAGYNVDGLHGIDFHASNPAYEKDGRILDPAHPETLVYAVAPNGRPVLMGAMFSMPEIGQPGPTVGGPLTVWHAHEDVCVSFMPPGLSGLLSPLGTCPVGSILIPRTAQMIHIWIVPGAPDPIGDLDDAWKRAFLQGVAASGR